MSEQSTSDRLLGAALTHVAFDGWSDETLMAAAADCAVDPAIARALFPRGGLDLALAYHRVGDETMLRALRERNDLEELRFRDRIALAVRLRLESTDREAVRRAAALMALPVNAPEAARAIWSTADAIWTALGDSSIDGNWYSKRAILSGVYSSTVLYWLGDDSDGSTETWSFLDRRIEDVMRFERQKAQIKASPALSATVGLPFRLLERIRKPVETGPMPGR